MQRTPITLKLALTLAVPIVVLAFATTLGVRSAAAERAEVRRQTELARAAIGPAGLLSTLQNERIWVAVDLLGFQDAYNAPVASYDEAFGQTNAARAELGRRVTGGSDLVAEAFAGPLGGLDELDRLRADIDAFRSSTHGSAENIEFAFSTWDRYTALTEPFYDATTRLVADIEDTGLRQGTQLSDDVARGIETFATTGERTVVVALLTENGVDTRDEIAELSRLRSNLARDAGAIASAEGAYDDLPSLPDAQQIINGIDQHVEEALATGRIRLDDFLASIEMPRGEGLFALQDDTHRLINLRADELDASAESRQVRLVVLAIAGIGFVLVLNLLVSVSITRPLGSLTRQANEVAYRRLPAAVRGMLDVPVGAEIAVPGIDPVTVETADELAEVAGALNTVQTSVVDLAARQVVYRRNISDLFVSLNGRNQALLRRQIGLIGELDSPTARPTVRASFSQLDHLATRIRRNTESLLAVAGVDAHRLWQAPVEVDEVVCYALSEVADPDRLVVHPLEPAAIAGANASDLVHLLAELIDSALAFAAADGQPVELRGGSKHETGGYWLAIIDFGADLTLREVQAANCELTGDDPAPSSGPASPDIPGTSRRQGARGVAGHLAKRAGVAVRVDSSAGWGVTSTIDIPGNLVVRRASDAYDPHLNACRSVRQRVALGLAE